MGTVRLLSILVVPYSVVQRVSYSAKRPILSDTTVGKEQVVHKPDATMRRIAVTTRSLSQNLQVLSKYGIRVD